MLGLVSVKRFKELEERVAKLRRDLDDRDLDWVDMRSRCKRLLDRTEKAARVANQNDTQAEPAADAPTNPTNGGGGRFLNAHQLEIQQKVLRRRAGGS